ncbi:MAG: hypothetical protein H0U57_05810 [Tatlockia sp.]|nr:hypothetical protein [Tatlockia sp.]
MNNTMMKINGLNIPDAYYPRALELVVLNEKAFYLTPINPVKARLQYLFSNTFLFFGLLTVAISFPLMKTLSSSAYYCALTMGFILSYFVTRIVAFFSNPYSDPVTQLANHLGYKSRYSCLKNFDQTMTEFIATANGREIGKESITFEELYTLLFRRSPQIKPKLKIVK